MIYDGRYDKMQEYVMGLHLFSMWGGVCFWPYEFTLPLLYHKVLQVHIKCWLCTIELMKLRKLTKMSKGPFIIYVQGGRDFEEGHIFGKSPIGGAYIWQILDGGALFWQCRYMKSLRNPLFSVFWAKIKLNKYCSICFQEGGALIFGNFDRRGHLFLVRFADQHLPPPLCP